METLRDLSPQRPAGGRQRCVTIVRVVRNRGILSGFDVESDWLLRSRGASVFHANNFKEKRQSNGTFLDNVYADSAAMRAASNTNTDHLVGTREVTLETDPAHTLSGGRALSIKTFDTSIADRGGGWQDRYKSDGSRVNGFYFQFSVFLQRDAMAWRLPQTDGQMKIFNLEQFGGGQVVVMASKNLGFPCLLINGSGLLERYLSSVPYKTGGDWFYQTAIDAGSSLSPGTRQAYLRRYGPGREIFNNLYDYGYVSGNASNNLLYNRGFDWPDSDAQLAGGVQYNLDGWTTIEVYLNNASMSNRVESFDVLKMWAAPYGHAPTLVCDMNDLPNDDPDTLGTAIGDGYQLFEPLWYDTAFGGATSDVGYRPPQQRWYGEFLGSFAQITFPNGYALP